MSLNSLVNEKKLKRHHIEEKIDESDINIYDLPDPVLALIISFLPTKEAIRTSLVSKRWQHLWKDISKINLKEEYREIQLLREFVSKLLVVCDCLNFTKFSFSCYVRENATKVNEWLCGFINPRIEELSLDLELIEKPLVFPHHLFTFARLTKFHLNMDHVLDLPSSIFLPSLRSLSLKNIIFPDSSSADRLFSGCPSLEELTLIYCNWMNVKAITISSPLLQKVVIRDYKYDDDDDDDDFSDSDYQSDEEDEEDDDGIGSQNGSKCCEIVVGGTNLKSFSYGGFPGNDYSLLSSNSVIEATINIDSPHDWFDDKDWEPLKDAGCFVSSLLEKLSCVERLRITETTFWVLKIRESLLWDVPVFSNLVEFRLFSDSPSELSYEPLLEMLKKTPCLRVISFENGVYMPIDRANMDPLPMCFKTHLKTIRIYNCGGLEKELHGIKILLQSATVLKTLHVRCRLFILWTSILELKRK
ncbi:F-box/LRR-repeat protein At3g26922 [Arachis duranensis]|uniref:F-box/LRR-repeat protein At3g26922 n=1 Tax=Arachis duranensis TaxID=130453 RepID=A0A6P4BFZ3_ARADU|nr:F-box/LRR-repeat protein At3g26922 [Arachis duranensis]XP_015941622.1 F-box/LRR-repeat protein At3g26922 [Arachis duranensis]